MGQHKHNPTALAAARGELKPLDRSKTLGSFELVSRFGGPITDDRYVWRGRSMRRRFPKVRGKANGKRAKRERIAKRVRAAAA